ncbi:hypothetical protein SNEBB_000208, partial [Seison nebaliae]
MTTLIHKSEIELEDIRDPYNTPPHILNKCGVCYTLTALQLIMASPSLMVLLYENNHCSPEICSQLQKNIPLKSKTKIKLEQNIEHAYLIHEVMIMMGFQSDDSQLHKGFSCKDHPHSSGCRKLEENVKLKETHIGKRECRSTNITNPLQLVRQKFLNYSFERPEIRTEQLQFYDDNDRKGIWKSLKNYFCSNFKSLSYKSTTDYVESNELDVNFNSVLMLIFNSLFYSGGGVRQNEIVAHTFYSNGSKEISELKYTSIFPLPQKVDHPYFLTYYPHLNLTFIKLTMFENITEDDVKTLGIYMYLSQPWENGVFHSANEWMTIQMTELVQKYSIPSSVIIGFERSHNFLMQFYPSSSMINDLAKNIRKSYMKHNEKYIFLTTYREFDAVYRIVQFSLPDNFWCGLTPCYKKLFKNCNSLKEEKNEEYEVFAFTLTMYQNEYRMWMKSFVSPNLINSEVERTMLKRLNVISNWLVSIPQIKNIIDEVNKYRENDIISYIKNVMEEIILKETLHNLEVTNIIKKSGIIIDGISNPSHALALVRSFSSNWWLVNNDKVVPIENLKEFFHSTDFLTTVTPENTAWQRRNTYQSLINNLRTVIKPMKRTPSDQNEVKERFSGSCFC